MADKIRVNYPALEDMAKHCQMVAERLATLAATSQRIAQQMANGALVGEPGNVFVQALNIFNARVVKLSNKFLEEADDIRQAMNDMRAADSTAGNNF